MLDPATEIEVPVLAVTIHPQTGQKLSLGGTYLNPLTGTVTPLELGGPMNEPKGGKIVPILGVNVDSNTGECVTGMESHSEGISSSPLRPPTWPVTMFTALRQKLSYATGT